MGGGIVAIFGFGWRDVADWPEETTIVEPVDPFKSGELDSFQCAPGPTPADDFSLEQAIDSFRERVVVAVANAADGGFDANLGEALGIVNRYVLGGFN